MSIMLSEAAICLGQQDPIYNQYMFNPLVLNPAYAGSRERISAIALHREQWLNLAGAPRTTTFSVHAPLLHHKLGIGFAVTNDAIGAYRRTGVSGSYAYRLKVGPGKLAMGLRASGNYYAFDWGSIDYKRDGDPLDRNDTKTTGWLGSFDFGLRYNTRKVYAGITLLNLTGDAFRAFESDTLNKEILATQVNITAGRAFEINEDIVLKPSLMTWWNPTLNLAPTVDLNMSVLIKKALWLGSSFRSSKGLVFILEYATSKKIRAGYSYTLGLTKLRQANNGSHEIFIGVDFGKKYKPILASPRIYF